MGEARVGGEAADVTAESPAGTRERVQAELSQLIGDLRAENERLLVRAEEAEAEREQSRRMFLRANNASLRFAEELEDVKARLLAAEQALRQLTEELRPYINHFGGILRGPYTNALAALVVGDVQEQEPAGG